MEAQQHRKLIGGRKVLHSQSREIIVNVYTFMKREAETEAAIHLKQVQRRVAEATGISLASVKRILAENKTVVQTGTQFNTPNKKRHRIKNKTELDDFDLCVVRRTVNEFHKTNGERPTIKTLLPVLKEKINFTGGKWSLGKVLRQLNFRWRKSVNNRKILIEKSDIRELRLKYLRTIQTYRSEGRPVIYMDESYVHSTHTKPLSWSDGSEAGLKTPISKGERLIIVHAGNEHGFVNNALLTFISGKKSGDYHGDMNFNNYEKWIRGKLIPNIPENSVIVIDNAPYHNVQLNPAPTSSTLKANMIQWLSERNIHYSTDMLKPELYSIIKGNKPKYKLFKIDSILAEAGHSVLRLPPYHPDLNPIEMVWSLLKENVAKRNVSFKLAEVQQLVVEICSHITKEQWLSRVNHVKTVELDYLALEPEIDVISEQLIINVGEDSDTEDDNDDSHTESDDEMCDMDLSGVEPLD